MSNFLKMHVSFRKLALLTSSGKEAPTLVDPLEQAIFQSLGTREAGNLTRYATENKSSPRAVIEKRVSKN
jgi:hypothetical protein